MADGDHPSMNERNAANEAAFKSLPAAGSPAYWARLEDTAQVSRLALETLVICARERLAAGRRDQFERILGALWDRVQRGVRRQVERATPRGARDRDGMINDTMQECVTALWLELARLDETFLTRGFWRKLRFIVANAITQRLIAEGIRTRRGVQHPDRAQQNQMVSFDQPVRPDEDYTIGDSIADPRAQDAFAHAEFVADMTQLMRELTADQRLLLENSLSGEMTQAELGELLGITDRAVRLRLKKLHGWLRKRLFGLDPSSGDSDGGATSDRREDV